MVRSSKPDDLDRLVGLHLPSALRFATRLTGDPDSAEDLVQDALVRVARGWSSFRGESEFRTWLFRIVINAFRDRLTSTRSANLVLPGDLADRRETDPALTAEHLELGQLVGRQVSALPPRQREVIVLIAFEGLSVRQVATMLDITEANVHATLRVARERLRRQLAPYFVRK
jgi:RNA polymerase sigma-70 factor (ECF subfamily)